MKIRYLIGVLVIGGSLAITGCQKQDLSNNQFVGHWVWAGHPYTNIDIGKWNSADIAPDSSGQKLVFNFHRPDYSGGSPITETYLGVPSDNALPLSNGETVSIQPNHTLTFRNFVAKKQ